VAQNQLTLSTHVSFRYNVHRQQTNTQPEKKLQHEKQENYTVGLHSCVQCSCLIVLLWTFLYTNLLQNLAC